MNELVCYRKALKLSYFFVFVLGVAVASTSDGRGLRRTQENEVSGYKPSEIECANARPAIRNATLLSTDEMNWLDKRRKNTMGALRSFLSRANITGLDTHSYIDKLISAEALPNIAIAISGGGWRAHMNGAGAIAAFDNITTNSTLPGHVGGLLQTATYIAGLSGGSWLIGSLYVPYLSSVEKLYRNDPNAPDSLWQFDDTILEGPSTLSLTEYYDRIVDEVESKESAGFNTTLTDVWGRALSFQLFNATHGGPNYTFSSLIQDPDFQSAKVPLPLIVAIERTPNQLHILPNSSIYEINPWEFGTFDPPVSAFAPLRFIGSNFSDGLVSENQSCVCGFDNVGFVVGTSSSLFNQAYLQLNKSNESSRLEEFVSRKLKEAGDQNSDISDWVNPFYNYLPEVNTNAYNQILPLVDGGENLQNIPLHPLLQLSRGIDVIFGVDSSADTSSPSANWPNGTALIATYERSFLQVGEKTPFPPIPDQNTFVNLGLNAQPTFFGCDPTNLTQFTPLIVYIPNTPYTYNSNISTFQMEISDEERNSIIQNGYNVASRGNGTIDNEWPACIGCAVLARSFWKTQTEVPEVCQRCFARYCWNGTTNSTTPQPYEPTHAIKTNSAEKMMWPLAAMRNTGGLLVFVKGPCAVSVVQDRRINSLTTRLKILDYRP